MRERQGFFEAMEADAGWQGWKPRQRRWKLAVVMAAVLLLLGASAPVRADTITADQIYGTYSDRLPESSPATQAPIPATALLLGTGFMGLLLLRRRSRKN